MSQTTEQQSTSALAEALSDLVVENNKTLFWERLTTSSIGNRRGSHHVCALLLHSYRHLLANTDHLSADRLTSWVDEQHERPGWL